MLKFKLAFSLLLFAIVWFGPAALHACPGCNALNNSLARAFNPSVLFMMAMPFAVVGSIAGGLVYVYRRAQKQANWPDNKVDEKEK